MLLVSAATRTRLRSTVKQANHSKPWTHHQLFRTFFASSTDHTTLLQNAEIHKLKEQQQWQYVMVAEGMDPEMVQKVPQLHLARLYRNQEDTLHGAKVVNSTLGKAKDVCGRLVDVALEDIPTGTRPRAKSNLWGLSEWIQHNLEKGDDANEVWLSLAETTRNVEIIKNDILTNNDILLNHDKSHPDYPTIIQAWEKLAREFLRQELGEEAALFQSKGFQLSEIIHHVDDSEYASSSGGSMALFIKSA